MNTEAGRSDALLLNPPFALALAGRTSAVTAAISVIAPRTHISARRP
jgi:hypothetical protein